MRDDQLDPTTLKDHHKRSTICTASGVEFDPFNPEAERVIPADLAHALANKCRFTGHTEWHYSVAQHCVLAAELAVSRGYSKEIAQWALLHDATEAYLPDVASPLKKLLAVWIDHPVVGPDVVSFKVMENRLAAAIATRFGLPSEEPHEVKVLDGAMYRLERDVLMPHTQWYTAPPPDRDSPKIERWTPEEAQIRYMTTGAWLGLW